MKHERLANKKTATLAIFYFSILKSASFQTTTISFNQNKSYNPNVNFNLNENRSIVAEFSALHSTINHKFQENQLAALQTHNNIYVAFLIDKSILKTDLFIKRTVLNYLDILKPNAGYKIIEYDDKNNNKLDFEYVFRSFF